MGVERADLLLCAQAYFHEHRSPFCSHSATPHIMLYPKSEDQYSWPTFGFGRGLVSKDNRLMKPLNHDMWHLPRHDSDDKKMADDKDADAFMLLYFWTAKQHKKRTIWVRRCLLDR